ncbi:hypothetical protein [Pseudomonas typographi]|uniref:hypothetical protein n=1 Tax=Pseudomonas typographi TaxID=2715964 RepID=UPI001685282F|nr:hypothetical protein [Pseudomonas typographi]MBD1589786.1 hypothetical protein [Pseudomonas typographi]
MSFSLDLKEFVEKAKANAEQVVQKVALDLTYAVIDRSPVGKPELWAVNKTATEYNNEVKRLNAESLNDPANLTKNGRLRPGKLIRDSMDLVTGKGYVGGRFRGNWQVSFETPIEESIERIDPQGTGTKGAAAQIIQTFELGVGSIWIMNNLPYGPRLEYEAWSRQAPAGMVRISVTEFQIFVNNAVSGLDK